MKKNYVTPSIEVVEFKYYDQVVASSIKYCDTGKSFVSGSGSNECENPDYNK